MTNTEPKSIGVSKKRWVVCFENTILDLDLSIYEKMVYIVLCSHAKKDGPAFPSVKTIAREASCSRTKVFEALKKLEEMGVIKRDHRIFGNRGQTSNLYEINDIEPRPQGGQGSGTDSPSPSAARTEESVTRIEESATRTGGVRTADGHIRVLEQDYMNKTKEHFNPPLPPQGAGEGESGNETSQKLQKTKHDTEDKAEIPKPRSETPETEFFEAIRGIYNTILPELAEAGKITAERAKVLRQRIMENPNRNQPEWWKNFFSRVREFPWPMGSNPNNWRADFDWLIGEKGMQKILEGTFRPFQRTSGTVRKPVFGEATAAGWELQKKYTHSGGLVDAKAMLRDIDAAEQRQRAFGNFGNAGEAGIGRSRGNPV
jgi:predicted transcriptional regulator